MFGNLDKEEIESILHDNILGRIGCHCDNTTYIVPISYAYDGDFFYALTGEGLKVNMMRKNPEICFEVEDIPDMGNWRSVICWGEYEELTETEERRHALELLNDRQLPHVTSATTRLSSSWPFRPDNIESIAGVVFRIRVSKKTGKYEKQDHASIYSWE
ncbi:MAG TPA: pyridoxamine 5'-phosphate oxidase family protein [Puia sp.]|nr:pyridoxamine 5'-phosphate oxidase family protein [Puia sp.]